MNVDPDGREIITLTLVAIAVVSAAISACAYSYTSYKSGTTAFSTQWWTGFGIAAGAGFIGGFAGGIAGPAIAGALGLGSGTLLGTTVGGAAGGMVGGVSGYGTAWGLSAATGQPTQGYSLQGMCVAGAIGGAIGAASGATIWAAGKAWVSFRGGPVSGVSPGNAQLAADGAAEGEALNGAKSVSPRATVQQGASQAQDAQAQAATKGAAQSRAAAAPGPRAIKSPTVEEPNQVLNSDQAASRAYKKLDTFPRDWPSNNGFRVQRYELR